MNNYHLSIKQIAQSCHVSDYVVKKQLKETTSTIPDYQKNLPRVINFDEFKTDTKEGKYAFVLNDSIHKKNIGCTFK